MKQHLYVLILAVFVSLAITSCGNKDNPVSPSGGLTQVLIKYFPGYDSLYATNQGNSRHRVFRNIDFTGSDSACLTFDYRTNDTLMFVVLLESINQQQYLAEISEPVYADGLIHKGVIGFHSPIYLMADSANINIFVLDNFYFMVTNYAFYKFVKQ